MRPFSYPISRLFGVIAVLLVFFLVPLLAYLFGSNPNTTLTSLTHGGKYFHINRDVFENNIDLLSTSIILCTLIFLGVYVLYGKQRIKWTNRNLIFYSLLLALLFSFPVLIHGPTNIEDYADGFVSGLVRLRGVLRGDFIHWYNGRGLGTPLPTIPSLDTHPLFAVAGISPRIMLSALWVTHLAGAAFFFLKLCVLIGVTKRIAIFCSIIYVFSQPIITTVVVNDWPASFIAFSLFPVILYFALRLCTEHSISGVIRLGALTTLTIVFSIYNGHPSVYFGQFVVLGFVLLFLFHQSDWFHRTAILTTLLLTICISIPRLHHIIFQLSFFPDIARDNQNYFTSEEIWRSNMLPFNGIFPSILNVLQSELPFSATLQQLANNITLHKDRMPFMGFLILYFALLTPGIYWSRLPKDVGFALIVLLGVIFLPLSVYLVIGAENSISLARIVLSFADSIFDSTLLPLTDFTTGQASQVGHYVLSVTYTSGLVIFLISVFLFFRRQAFIGSNRLVFQIDSALLVGWLVSLIIMTTPSRLTLNLFNSWTSFHEFILLSIIACGLTLSKNFLFIPKNTTKVILLLCLFQVLIVNSYQIFFSGMTLDVKRPNATNFFQSKGDSSPLVDWLSVNLKNHDGRLLLSPQIENELACECPKYSDQGLHSIPDLNLSLGVSVLNDVNLKGISMDALTPATRFTKGYIHSTYDLIRNRSLLNFLGITWIIVRKEELHDLGGRLDFTVFSQHTIPPNPPAREDPTTWLLLHNTKSWPLVNAYSTDIVDFRPGRFDTCEHDRLLCLDVSSLENFRVSQGENIVNNNNSIAFDLRPSAEDTITVLPVLYRPGWMAYSGAKQLEISPLFDSVLGIHTPPNTGNIYLIYRPSLFPLLETIALIFTILCIFLAISPKSIVRLFNIRQHGTPSSFS